MNRKVYLFHCFAFIGKHIYFFIQNDYKNIHHFRVPAFINFSIYEYLEKKCCAHVRLGQTGTAYWHNDRENVKIEFF